MKKILFIGIGNKDHATQRMVKALEKKNLPYIFSKWSELSFCGDNVYIGTKEINFDNISAVFYDIHRLTITRKIDDQNKIEIDYHLENELHTLLTILKEKNIYAPNRDYFLKYPYYNKFTQSYIFSNKKIASIPTIHLNDNRADKAIAMLKKLKWKFPIVVKESYGARGSKVWKVANRKELEEFFKNKRNISIVLQPYLKNNCDFRAIVVEEKCLGIMKREAKSGEWRNNFSLGGKVGDYNDQLMEKFAEDACRKMGLDIAGLDIFSAEKGFIIIECNLFFGLDGFESVYPNINVSEKIIDLILKNNK